MLIVSFKIQNRLKEEIIFIYFFIDPGFKVDSLENTSVTIAPAAPSGYICTPPIPQGELTTSGTLIISGGLDASSEGEYRCVSDDVNGTVIIDLDVVGMYKYTSLNLTYIFHCPIRNAYD